LLQYIYCWEKLFKLLYCSLENLQYNINSIVGYDECVIVEGEMDVLALHEAGIQNVISVPNGATLNNNNLEKSLHSWLTYGEIMLLRLTKWLVL